MGFLSGKSTLRPMRGSGCASVGVAAEVGDVGDGGSWARVALTSSLVVGMS